MAVLTRQEVHFGPLVDPSFGGVSMPGRRRLRRQPIEVLTIRLERPRLRTLPKVCLAIAMMASVGDRVIAAAQTTSVQTSAMICPHPLDKDGNRLWKPTDADLHRIVARNLGFVAKKYPVKSGPGLDLQSHDAYLDNLPGWQNEALKNPERANLCNADLRGA